MWSKKRLQATPTGYLGNTRRFCSVTLFMRSVGFGALASAARLDAALARLLAALLRCSTDAVPFFGSGDAAAAVVEEAVDWFAVSEV